MKTNDNCGICLSEYTVDNFHRPVVLKCGHLFGNECLEKWLKNKNACPTCSKSCRKSDIRKIYGTSICVYDSEKENRLIKQLLDSNHEIEVLKKENALCIKTIECLRNEIFRLEDNKLKVLREDTCISPKEYKRYHFNKKIKLTGNKTKLVFDKSSLQVFVSLIKDSRMIIVIYDYELEKVSSLKPIDLEKNKINTYSIHCENAFDNTVHIIYNNKIVFYDTTNHSEYYCLEHYTHVKSFSISRDYRSMFYFVNDEGFLFEFDYKTKKEKRKIFIEHGVYDMKVLKGFIFVVSIFNIYKFSLIADKSEPEKIVFDKKGIFTNIFSNNERLFVTLRGHECKTKHCLLEIPTSTMNNYTFSHIEPNIIIINTNVTQFRRYYDKIIDGFLYVIEEKGNKIYVYSLESNKIICTYQFRDRVIDFDGFKKRLYVLTEKYLVLMLN